MLPPRSPSAFAICLVFAACSVPSHACAQLTLPIPSDPALTELPLYAQALLRAWNCPLVTDALVLRIQR